MLHAPSCVELFLQCNRQFSLLVLRYGRGFLTFYYKIHSPSRYLFSAGSFLNTPVKFSLINNSFNQTVLSLSGSENLLSHIHSREKGGFQIIQELLRTSGSQPDCSASADPRSRWKAGRGNRPLPGLRRRSSTTEHRGRSLLPAQFACHHDRGAAHEEYMARVEVQTTQSAALPPAG